MSAYIGTFERNEIKFLLSLEQYRALRQALEGLAQVDEYGETQILNIYYDTPGSTLIRTSMEKPRYKEKLRLRCYGVPTDESPAFAEIKKKYQGIVYKRRVALPYLQAAAHLDGRDETPLPGQIGREIDYFRRLYPGLRPAMMISYERIAMAGIDDPELRITFDRHIRYRERDLDLRLGGAGREILDPDQVLMELKVPGAVPLQISAMLNALGIRQCSLSKYGAAFTDLCRRQGTAKVIGLPQGAADGRERKRRSRRERQPVRPSAAAWGERIGG